MKFRFEKAEQGSPEWLSQRLGKITASKFDKLVTLTGKPSSSTSTLVNKAVAELAIGQAEEEFISNAMIRGQELEHDAFESFNFMFDLNMEKVGFGQCYGEKDYLFGFSPDGFNFKDNFGGEFKCPLAHTHISYLSSGELPKQYFQQVQGSIALSGADRWFFGSYHPNLPPFGVWVEPDKDWIAKFNEQIMVAENQIRKNVKKLKEQGVSFELEI